MVKWNKKYRRKGENWKKNEVDILQRSIWVVGDQGVQEG